MMNVITIFGILQLYIVYGAILPPPWADPTRNRCATQPGGWLLLYWPKDGKCYRIFQSGSPCPPTMELSPGEDDQGIILGECKCPPRTAQIPSEEVCYPIYSKGPCEKGHYFAPTTSPNNKRIGHCLKIPQCRQNEVHWPLTNQCFPKYSRGPCPEGQLIGLDKDTLIAECQCSKNGPLSKYYWPHTKTCHQHYTKGPCLEKGTLFLPGPTCGCHQLLPNFDSETNKCYEIGGRGPCKFGQLFTLDTFTKKASCVCKPEHIPWADGQCYRLFTRGPCNNNQILLQNATCRDLPCPKGKLYFPEDDSCHRVGVRGPCARGELVLFEQSIKSSVEGISYRGICGCPGPNKCNATESREVFIEGRNVPNILEEQAADAKSAKAVPTNATVDLGEIRICERNEDPQIDACYLLYTEGPCSTGEWLLPVRQGREEKQLHRFGHVLTDYEQPLYQQVKNTVRVRCDCKPGYTKDKRNGSCRLPLITLAQFLNGKDLFR